MDFVVCPSILLSKARLDTQARRESANSGYPHSALVLQVESEPALQTRSTVQAMFSLLRVLARPALSRTPFVPHTAFPVFQPCCSASANNTFHSSAPTLRTLNQ